MSKKVLSLALVVVMLFSVLSITSSAAVGDGKSVGIVVVSDAEVGAPIGTEVNVSVYYDLPDGTDELQMCIGNISLGYNNTVYQVDSDYSAGANFADDARTWGDVFGTYMKDTAHANVASSAQIVKKFNANDTAKGWNAGIQIQQLYNGDNGFSASTGFPVTDMMHVFTLRFKTLKVLTAADVIGVVEGAYGKTSALFKVAYFNGTSTPAGYDLSAVDISEAAPAPSAPSTPVKADVYELSAPRKHADGEKYTVAAFFAFDGAKIAPNFNEAGTSQFIQSIAATVTATSGGQSITVTPDAIKYVYDLKDGTYGFRVIMKNVPADAEITIVPAVTTDGTAYTVDTLNFNVADVTAY